jgi:ATP-dependent DNA helicase RecG
MEQHRPDRVMLELPMVSLLPEGVLDALRLQFGPALDRLNGDEVRAVVTARLEGQVTNRRLQGMLTLHSTDIGRMLGHLVNRQFLVSHGVGRGTRYVVTEPKTPQLGLVTPYVSPEAPYVSPEAPYVSAGSPYLGPGTPPLNDPVAQFENQTDLKESPGQMALRKVQKSQRTGPDTVRAAILYLCTDKFMSSQEIAGALGRNATRLQVRFLTPLFRSGLLRLRYPDKLNHPLQAYTHKPLDKREDPPS